MVYEFVERSEFEMRLIKKIVFLMLLILLLFVAAGFLLPAKWRVERSAVINAPPSTIYVFISNLKMGWPQWSAFDSEDPNIQYSYSGPEAGVGATRAWKSKKMGDGSQRITEADALQGI